jgi:ParB family chromosome partitioning protein
MPKDKFAGLDAISVLPTRQQPGHAGVVPEQQQPKKRAASAAATSPRAAGDGGGLFEDTSRATPQGRLVEIPLAEIEPDLDQPRRDLGDLSGIQESLARYGLLQPILVSPLGRRRYRLLAGERRFRAAQALGWATVPALVRTVEEHERLYLQVIENVQRKDLNPFEEAESYRRLMDEFGLTQEEVARRVGKSRVAVNQTLRVLDLPESVRVECQTSDISDIPSKSVLLEIAKQDGEAAQRALWEQAKQGTLTVQKARAQKAGARAGMKGAAKALDAPAATAGASRNGMSFRYPIHTDEAVVTVTFADRASADFDDIIAALEQALEGERQRRQPR